MVFNVGASSLCEIETKRTALMMLMMMTTIWLLLMTHDDAAHAETERSQIFQCSCEVESMVRARAAAFADSSKQGSSAAVQTHAGCLELFLGAWAVLFTAPESLKLSLVRDFYIDIHLWQT